MVSKRKTTSAMYRSHIEVGSIVVASIFIAAAVWLFLAWGPGPAKNGMDAVLRENAQLMARQETLRGAAFDLAAQLDQRVERGRRVARLAGSAGQPWDAECPLPPARDAGDEAILAWLAEVGAWLEQTSTSSTAPSAR